MSDRRFDMSGQQITASVLAAVSGAVLASYLGVAGTIIGTAVMSLAGTAGTAVYKHYLSRTARHLRETQTVAAAQRAAEWITAGTHTTVPHGAAARQAAQHGVATGTAAASGSTGTGRDAEPGETPPAGRAAHRDTTADAGAAGGTGPAEQADATHGAEPAGGAGAAQDAATAAGAQTGPGWLARWRDAVRGWPRWAQLTAVSAMIFVGVIGTVTVVEAAAGQPLQTVVWNHKASGTTIGNLVGGRPSHTRPASTHPTPSSTAPSSSAPASSRTGSASPSPSSSSGSPSPSPTPTTSTTSPSSTSPSPDPTGTSAVTGSSG